MMSIYDVYFLYRDGIDNSLLFKSVHSDHSVFYQSAVSPSEQPIGKAVAMMQMSRQTIKKYWRKANQTRLARLYHEGVSHAQGIP